MQDPSAGAPATATHRERIVGRHGGGRPGPVLIVVGALHGNEPAGIAGSERVLAALSARAPEFRGTMVCLAGNLAALAAGRRFIESDLNRMWLPERVATVAAMDDERLLAPEDRELRGLWEAIRSALVDAREGAYLVDLHTSSAAGCPFLTVGDTLRNRRFASGFPLPLILGLEEQIDGPLLEFLNNLGLITLCVEAGQHRAAASVDHVESALWIALVGAGMLAGADVPDLAGHRRRLADATRGIPRVIEVRHRHPLRHGDGFRMKPGFEHFHPVRRGEVLAHDDDGPIAAVEDGRVLLPLYQGQGDDGFFLSREVRPFWLAVSSALRRTGAGGLIRALPGVRRHPSDPEALIVDTRIARLYPLEVFHLLGYRKLRRTASELVVARRRHDLRPPDRYVDPATAGPSRSSC